MSRDEHLFWGLGILGAAVGLSYIGMTEGNLFVSSLATICYFFGVLTLVTMPPSNKG